MRVLPAFIAISMAISASSMGTFNTVSCSCGSRSGGGGVIIALCSSGEEEAIARSITETGGAAVASRAGAPGVKLEDEMVWKGLSATELLDPPTTGTFAGTALK